MKLHRRPSPKRARIEMLPLIDIVFLVLVVFIYAMLSMAVHRGLPVALPQSAAAGIDTETPLAVSIQADGAIYINREQVQLEQLSSRLAAMTAGEAEPGVLLFADRNLSYQQLFKVFDQIGKAGLERISLQAEVAEQP
jgi:biopolymer transport protein ExbD